MAEFVTQAENKRRMITIVVCVIFDTLALACGIYAIKAASDTEQGEKNPESIKILSAKCEELEKANRAAEDNWILFGQPIGWRMHASWTTDRFATGGLNPDELQEFLNEWAVELKTTGERETRKSGLIRRAEELKRRAGEYKAKPANGDDSTSLDAFIAAVDQAITGVNKTDYMLWEARSDGKTALHLKQLFEELEKLENAYIALAKAISDRIAAAEKAEKDAIAEGEKAREDANTKLLKTIDDLIGGGRDGKQPDRVLKEIGGVIGDLKKTEEDRPKDLAVKEVELDGKLKELNEHDKRNRQYKVEAELRLKDLQARINWFKHRREEARERREPDGEVVGVIGERQIAYIDLLHKDRLFRGTKFRVYSPERGGIKIDKGEVEVIEVRENGTSIVSITKVIDPKDPIKPGDRIYNEMYEKGKARYIAFAGRLPGRLSNDEAANIIRKFGDFYQERVDEKTNYLVVGEGYETDPNWALAQEWGVKILLERTLHEYLGVK